MRLDIEIIAPEDITLVLALERKIFPLPLSEGDIRAHLSDGLSFSARSGPEFAGYIFCEKILDECHIIRIAVREDLRRAGIASALIERLISEGKQAGISKYCLEVRVSNEPSIKLYGKMGFGEVYIRRKYYQDNDEDAVFMERSSE